MITDSLGSYVLAGTVFAVMFAILQIVVWRRKRVIVGATSKFAQYVIATSTGLAGAGIMCQSLLLSKVRFFSGMPSAVPNGLTTLASWILPAFLMLEAILLTECAVTDSTPSGAWQWHLSALLFCVVWTIMLICTPAMG